MKGDEELGIYGNPAQYVIEEHFKKLSEYEDSIIIQKIKEKTGIELDLEDEAKRRFKRFHTVFKEDERTIYFNDGSEEGLRIVTFVTKLLPFDPSNMSMGFETHYY